MRLRRNRRSPTSRAPCPRMVRRTAGRSDAVFVRHSNGMPVLPDSYAYHFENEKFVSYLEIVATRLCVVIKDDTVVEVLQNDVGVAGLRLASGPTITADLYIDSSGFASVLLGQALKEPFVSFKSSASARKHSVARSACRPGTVLRWRGSAPRMAQDCAAIWLPWLLRWVARCRGFGSTELRSGD